ncbi:MAG: CatA-like O-acetyltransferase [Gemmatimonadota bacterium]
MRVINITNPHQRRHFDFFHSMNHPHWSICADVEIGPWLRMARAKGFKITPAIVHLLARAANDVPQLRRRIRDDRIVEHEVVHPTFSVATDVAEAFSFCHVPYGSDLADFVQRAVRNMEEVRTDPVFEDEEGRDDYLFMSALPWISFTSIQHAMHYHPHDSVPRISWGKFREADGRVTMPLSLQSHHALVDGVHAGAFFQGVEMLVAETAEAAERAQADGKTAPR